MKLVPAGANEKLLMLHTPAADLTGAASTQLLTREERALAQASLELSHWRTRLRFDDLSQTCSVYARGAERAYLRLPSREGCETWLIVWPPGARAPLHDHGGASALATVLSGELRESLQFGTGHWVERTWRSGSRCEIAAHARHEVWNASENTAYSLHVYTPRLASMTFYERTREGGLRTLHSQRAEPW